MYIIKYYIVLQLRLFGEIDMAPSKLGRGLRFKAVCKLHWEGRIVSISTAEKTVCMLREDYYR